MCTYEYTYGGLKLLINKKDKTLYQFDIRCPCCKRKLMILNLSNFNKPQVSVLEREEFGIHNTEIRCPICKSFVAVDV
jgi:ssDNA-binding Zn-finger/Zn-ribbon topoisomerase 1